MRTSANVPTLQDCLGSCPITRLAYLNCSRDVWSQPQAKPIQPIPKPDSRCRAALATGPRMSRLPRWPLGGMQLNNLSNFIGERQEKFNNNTPDRKGKEGTTTASQNSQRVFSLKKKKRGTYHHQPYRSPYLRSIRVLTLGTLTWYCIQIQLHLQLPLQSFIR